MTDVELGRLGRLEWLSSGGQGVVFRLQERPGLLFKRYRRLVEVDAAALGRLIDLPQRMSAIDRDQLRRLTAWPVGRVFDGPRCAGALIGEAPGRFTTTLAGRPRLLELQFLLYPQRAMWAELVLPTAAQRRDLIRQYLNLFALLQRNGVIFADVSMKNLLWTLDGGPGVFAIDCDSCQLTGTAPAVSLAETTGWRHPRAPCGRVTAQAGRYKLALLIVRVLLADPAVTPEEVCARPDLHAAVGSALAALVERASVPGASPPAHHWLLGLAGDAPAERPVHADPIQLWSIPDLHPVPVPVAARGAGADEGSRMVALDELVKDLKVLRKGRGLFVSQVDGRLGPALRAVCGVSDQDGLESIRKKVAGTLERLADGLPADLRTAVLAAYAICPDARLPLYRDRVVWVAAQLHREPRTVRRRIDEGIWQLAQLAVNTTPVADPAPSGWRITDLRVALALDRDRPELLEQIRIAADTPCTLIPPNALWRGQRHDFWLLFRLGADYAMRYFACVPRYRCDRFELRIRFDPARLPATIWPLSGVFQRDVEHPVPSGRTVSVDRTGEVQVSFCRLSPGMAYGVRWAGGRGWP